ncbi:MAG: metalloregulator ArsR/SmtB family transcription factor [Candidatus Thermoplasmatota archaeon]
MAIKMADPSGARYRRLREQGGARLNDPRAALARVAEEPFADVRLAMFRALADPNRFLLIELLRHHGPLATTELEIALGLTSGTVSHHLRVLESARLVVPESVGGWTFWRVVAYPMIETLVPVGTSGRPQLR